MEQNTFSRIGVGIVLTCAVPYLVSPSISLLLDSFGLPYYGILMVVQTIYYLACIGIMKLSLIGIPRAPAPVKTRAYFSELLQFFLIIFGLLVIGAVLGNVVSFALAELVNGTATNPIDNLMNDVPTWIFVVRILVLAPIFEEFLFRRITLDALRPFGDRTASIMCGLLFGLFHMNFNQFFYATLLGFVLSYIMLRTNNLWYPILLHFFINLIGSFLVPSIAEWIGYNNEIGQFIFNCVYYFLCVAGVILFVVRLRHFIFIPTHYRFSRPIRFGVQFGNPGMLALWLLFLAESIIALRPSWLPDFLY